MSEKISRTVLIHGIRHAQTDAELWARALSALNGLGFKYQDFGVHESLNSLNMTPDSDLYLADVRFRNQEHQQQSRLGSCSQGSVPRRIIWFCDDWGIKNTSDLDSEKAQHEFFAVSPFEPAQLRNSVQAACDFFSLDHGSRGGSPVTSDAILSCLHDGIVVSDASGVVTYANRKMCAITGRSLPTMLYAPLDEVLQLVEVQALIRTDDDSYQNANTGTEWCKVVHVSGELYPVEKWEIPFRGLDGTRIGTVIGLRDNSAEQEYIRRIEKARARAEMASNAKNEFLANISHELRTPLNSILGMTELALDIANNREQEEYLRILRVSADSLYDLISSTLDYVKLESGTFNIRERGFNLVDTIDSIAATFGIQAHMKHLAFHIVTEPNDSFNYIGDETRINQIINNLLSNALKFTESGEIVLSIRELPRDQEPSSDRFRDSRPLEIKVSDTGIGIESQRLWDIFQPFMQIEPTAHRNVTGTGIGLTITRMLVEAMGGKIRVSSSPGKGSDFTCTVWLKQGGVRRIPETHGLLSDSVIFLLVSQSKSWCAAVEPWLQYLKIKSIVCPTADDFERRFLELRDFQVHCIFHGMFPESEKLLALSLKPEMSHLNGGRHMITLRMSREEEEKWKMVPFAYSSIMEPLRISSLMAGIKELEIEDFGKTSPEVSRLFLVEKRLRILVVDENPRDFDDSEKLLLEAGHTLVRVFDRASAQERVATSYFDVFIVDVDSPQLQGNELVDAVRLSGKNEPPAQRAVIALTQRNRHSGKRIRDSGRFDAILPKPFAPQSIVPLVERVWQHVSATSRNGRDERNPSYSRQLFQRIEQSLQQGEWESAQKTCQELRLDFKKKAATSLADLCFRLVLALRRHESGEAITLLEEIRRHEGEHHEGIGS